MNKKAGLVAHPFNFSNWEAETGGSRFKASPVNLVSSRRGRVIETPCPKTKTKERGKKRDMGKSCVY